MSASPVVSVIIPCYNCASTIVETINSVQKQTYPKELIQVILINDGSQDKTKEILDNYAKDYLVIHTENKGVSHARNVGLQYSKGDYIQYLDSDDILVMDKIEKQVTALSVSGGDVAYGNFQKFKVIEGEIKLGETIKKQIIVGSEEIAAFTYFWCPPAALLYSKQMVQKIGPWKEWLPVIQDARYILDAVRGGGKFIYTPFNVALYREHQSGSLSTKNKAAFIRDCFNNAKSIYNLWIKENKLDAEHKNALCTVFGSVLPGLIKFDKKLFLECCSIIEQLDRKYLIKSSFLKENVCRLIGFKNTEFISYHLKQFFN